LFGQGDQACRIDLIGLLRLRGKNALLKGVEAGDRQSFRPSQDLIRRAIVVAPLGTSPRI